MKIIRDGEVDILLISEGTYPYIRGGVSSWIHQLINGLPEFKFGVVFLGSQESDYSEIRYELPDNLTYLYVDYLFKEYIDEINSKPFHWPLYFPEVFQNGGFDAIVGNPPYVRQELIKEYKNYFSNYYACYTGTADLYVYFFERAYELLKENGRLGFITSNKYFRAKYGEKLREFLIKNTKIDGSMSDNQVLSIVLGSIAGGGALLGAAAYYYIKIK